MSREVTLVVPNQADFFLRNPKYAVSGEARDQIVRFGGTYECEHSLAWTSGPRVLVLPAGYDEVWFQDIHAQWGLTPPPVASPVSRSGLLTRDLLDDPKAMSLIRDLVDGADLVHVQCYGPAPSTYELLGRIRSWGLQVELDAVSEDRYWVSSWLETKLSCLDLSSMNPDILIAESMVVADESEVEGAAEWMFERHGGVVVRTPFGVAGDGTVIVRSRQDLEGLKRRVVNDAFFVFPLLVQQFIPHAPNIGCPAADILIGPDGVAEVVVCSLTVEDDHLFRSVRIGPDALPEEWTARLLALVDIVGSAAHEMGYRGWLCVDTVAGEDERVYLTEINARRSGSTFGGSLLKSWSDHPETTLSAHFLIPVPAGLDYVRDLRPLFQRRWDAGERVYPTTVRGLAWDNPILAVMGAGATASEAEAVVASVVAELKAGV